MLSSSRRVRLHTRIAEALEELYSADLEAHATELAHHFAEAEPVLGPATFLRFSYLAGKQHWPIMPMKERWSTFKGRCLPWKGGQQALI